jgi:hypothetical protein
LVEQLGALDVEEEAAAFLTVRSVTFLARELATALAIRSCRSRAGRTAGCPWAPSARAREEVLVQERQLDGVADRLDLAARPPITE